MKLLLILLVFLICLNLGACSAGVRDINPLPAAEKSNMALFPAEPLEEPQVTADEVYSILCANRNAPSFMDYSFVRWLGDTSGADVYRQFFYTASGADLSGSAFWYNICGMTLNVLKDLYSGTAENTDNIYITGNKTGSLVTLAFTGDVCLADEWENMEVYRKNGSVLSSCITGGLLEIMNTADIMYINNEFTFSDRGEPLVNKYYTFRASPSDVTLLAEMGVDIVSLANNHVYDYGAEAFLDTLKTLDSAGIPYTGAGRDITDAAKPRYFIVNGIKIAFVAASRAEKFILTPEAKENSGGILRTYDPRRFIAAISEAKANADYVIACPHWGTENSAVLEEAQTSQARQYIDAGADAVVGSHTHCLQGMEFYKDCPIMYSLGNFWFNHDAGDTALLEIEINNGTVSLSLVPCLQSGGITASAAGTDEGRRILKYIESISIGVVIDETGRITAAE